MTRTRCIRIDDDTWEAICLEAYYERSTASEWVRRVVKGELEHRRAIDRETERRAAEVRCKRCGKTLRPDCTLHTCCPIMVSGVVDEAPTGEESGS